MESIFKFKKAKKMVGNFDADDPHEWTLLTKPQIGNVTLFVHFHKLWLIQEQPAIEADEDNGIEGQEEIKRQPYCEVFFGFVKDDKFVIERQNSFKERIDELAQKTFLKNLQKYLDDGYDKDWTNYNADNSPVPPHYYEHQKSGSPMGSPQQVMNMMQQVTKGIIPSGRKPHVMLKPQGTISAQPQQNNP